MSRRKKRAALPLFRQLRVEASVKAEPEPPSPPETGRMAVMEYFSPSRSLQIIQNQPADWMNRPLRRAHLKRLIDAMRAGKFIFNADTIKIGARGEVLDGQHRLHASVESGVGFWAYVVYGLPREIFPTLNTGATSSAADALGQIGIKNAKTAAAMVAALMRINGELHWATGKIGLRADEVIPAFVALGPLAVVAVSECLHIRRPWPPPGLSSALFYRFAQVSSVELASTFFALLREGTNLHVGHPILALRKRLISANGSTLHSINNSRNFEMCYLVIRAWNAFITGRRDVKLLKVVESASIVPAIQGPGILVEDEAE